MSEKDAWELLAERFDIEYFHAGICGAINHLHNWQRITLDVHTVMLRRLSLWRFNNDSYGGYIWPTREHANYLPEHSANRASLCRQFAAECAKEEKNHDQRTKTS